MTCRSRTQRTQSEELTAQRIACGYVVRACEQALIELELDLATVDWPGEREPMEQAGLVLADLLADWRESFLLLRAAAALDGGQPVTILPAANAR